MKQKLLLMLKTLFASKGFSQKALEGLAEILAPNLTEESTTEDLTAAIEGLKPMTDIMQSEINRQVNDAKKPKPVDPKPTNPPVETPDVDPNETPTEKMLKEAIQGITALTAEVAYIKAEKVGNTRRSQYEKALEGTSEAYKTKALKDFDRLSFKDDEDFNSWLTESTEDAKGFAQEETNNGLGGERPVGGTGGVKAAGAVKEASAAEVDAAVESIINI